MDRWEKEQPTDWTPSGHHGKAHFNANPTYRLSTGGSAAPWGTDETDAGMSENRHGAYRGVKPVHDHQSIHAAQHGLAHLTEPNLVDPEHMDPTHFHPEDYPEESSGRAYHTSLPAGYTHPKGKDDFLPRELDPNTRPNGAALSRTAAPLADPHAEYALLQAADAKTAALDSSMARLLANNHATPAPSEQARLSSGAAQRAAALAPPAVRGANERGPPRGGAPPGHHLHAAEPLEAPHHWNNLSTGGSAACAPYATDSNSGVRTGSARSTGRAPGRSVVGLTTDDHAEGHHYARDGRYQLTTGAGSRVNAPFAYDT